MGASLRATAGGRGQRRIGKGKQDLFAKIK
jgi:hypothetical protein